MSGEIIESSQWDSQQIEILRTLIAPGVTDEEFALFEHVCKQTGLDPFARQIYPIVRNVWNKQTRQKEPKMTIQVSIDGLRLIADRRGNYAGSETLWCGPDGKWVDVWLKPGPPAAAKTTVWKSSSSRPFVGVARFDAYCQRYEGKPQGLWETMPDVMIGKCSEALALRKAFPAEMSGLYTREEMQQADNVEVLEVPLPKPKATPAPRPSRTLAEQVKELIDYGKANGLTVTQIKELCRLNSLPDTAAGYTDPAQVTTLAAVIEDAIALSDETPVHEALGDTSYEETLG